jgi:glutamyl-tRNA reductase
VSVVVVGLNHRTVPLRLLEPMTVAPAQLPKALHELTTQDHLDEVVVVSTCMRTEIYAVASRFHGAMSDIRRFLSVWSGRPPEAFSDHLYSYYEEGTARHLFRVAAGLDSAVLGEGEVLHQIRDAWEAARIEGAAGPVLGMLFRQAVESGKRVRTETAIARGTTSLSHAAVALATERLGTLAGRTTLIIGAGEMGESMASALPEGSGPLVVANRTWDRATSLAGRFGGRAVTWPRLPGALERADVLLTSTGAPDVVLDAAELEPVMARRADRPLLIVDVAVPRDVDPRAGELPGVTLLDMDDLKDFAEAAVASRRQEVPRAEAIVAEEVERYLEVAAQREVAPLVASLHERAEGIRSAEVDRFRHRLGALDERQRGAVESLTRGIVAKLLHDPTINVKASAGTPRGEQLAQALRQLFEL